MLLVGASLFAAAPVLIRHYTFPPGLDPIYLEANLDHWKQRYIGHLPARWLGITLYYYLTPVLTLAGVWALLRRYGVWAIVLGWTSLWLMCRTLLFDLHAGSFVGVINFYALGLIMLRLQALWIEGRLRGWWSMGAAVILLPFHNFTGLALGAAELIWGLSIQSWRVLSIAAIINGTALVAIFFLPSSIRLATQWLFPTLPGVQLPHFFSLEFDRFIIEYVGFGVLVYWFLAFNSVMYAWRAGWRPPVDTAMAVLTVALVPLLFMTFTPFAINGDRTGKLVVGISVLLATAGIMAGLRYLNNRWLNWASAGIIVGCFGLATPQIWTYWLISGNYR